MGEEILDGAEVWRAHRSVCVFHFIHIMTLDIDVFGSRHCCELYHNSEDCSRKENVSREYL